MMLRIWMQHWQEKVRQRWLHLLVMLIPRHGVPEAAHLMTVIVTNAGTYARAAERAAGPAQTPGQLMTSGRRSLSGW